MFRKVYGLIFLNFRLNYISKPRRHTFNGRYELENKRPETQASRHELGEKMGHLPRKHEIGDTI